MSQVEYRLGIKDLPPEERPRERLMRLGPEVLSNSELLAILIRSGTRRRNVLDVARDLLTADSSPLEFLRRASLEELQAIPGIGLAKAVEIKAAIELGRRVGAPALNRVIVKSPQDARDILMERLKHLEKEQFYIILLNTKNHVLGIEQISIGSLNASIVNPREVFRVAIRRNAAAVILVHNHPSGDPVPSREDLDVTQRLVEGGRLLGIEVLDHIIIGDHRYTSLRERGIQWK